MEHQYDAFISYKSEYRELALKLVTALEESGLACWIDKKNINATRDYAAEINKGLKKCKCLVLLFNQGANDSPDVRQEVSIAKQKHKKVVVIKLEDVTYHDSLEYHFATNQYIDAKSGITQQVINQTISAINDDSFEASIPSPTLISKLFKGLTRSLNLIGKSLSIITAIAICVIGYSLYHFISSLNQGGSSATIPIAAPQDISTINTEDIKYELEEHTPNIWNLKLTLPYPLGATTNGYYSFDKKTYFPINNYFFSQVKNPTSNTLFIKIEHKTNDSVLGPFEIDFDFNEATKIKQDDIKFRFGYEVGVMTGSHHTMMATDYGPFWTIRVKLPHGKNTENGRLQFSTDKDTWEDLLANQNTPIHGASADNVIYLKYETDMGDEQIFGYPVDFLAQAKFALKKNVANMYRKTPSRVLDCYHNNCKINPLVMPVIKSIRYGSSPNDLNFKIEYDFNNKLLNNARYLTKESNNQNFEVDAKLCSELVHYQFTYFDESSSEIYDTNKRLIGRCEK